MTQWIRKTCGAVGLAVLCATALQRPAAADFASIREVRSESAAARETRHRRVVERRAGPMIIVHRGASAIAPENSLEAYAAAMDYGADGCEIDFRRTRDGVLVLFHDDMLDRLLDDVGAINELTFAELMKTRPRLRSNRVLASPAPPTFAALLELARQRAMLLHLDIKEPGLEDDIAGLLTRADAWDHVVSVNAYNATNLLRNPKLKLLRYKAGLFDGRRDMDPAAVEAALPGPGEMIIVDDPRVAARALKRPPYQPVSLPRSLCADLQRGRNLPLPPSTNFNLHAFFHALGKPARERALPILGADFPEASEPDGDPAYEHRRTERIVERAWAAHAVAPERKTPPLVQRLENQMRHRSLHRDWRYHGLDGIMAARTLAGLRATESAPVFIEMFLRVDPDLKKIADPQWSEYPLVWRDARFKMELLPALGKLRCAASKNFLLEYVAKNEARARQLAPPQFEEATRALLLQDLTREELEALLRHSNLAVRGTAILECLDRPTRERTKALKAAAPWALELPRARRCKTRD
ncbi:MAG: glycerophosphodiester phosphodiesterase family protein [Verrucomicrobia bacterium]|nr:glycerophosphodiester phosphodiesterase family protein [Verrucomicrobiota bacterium]